MHLDGRVGVRLAALALFLAATPVAADDGAWSLVEVMPARGQAMVIDPVRQRAVAFGGGDATLLHNAVWTLSLTDPAASWTLLPTQGTPPSARSDAGLVYDSARDRLLVFGGTERFTGVSDVWSLPLTGTPTWSPVTTAGAPPPTLAGRTTVYDSVHDQLLVFGGIYGGVSNATYALSLAGTPTWSTLATNGAPALYFHAATFDPAHDRMLVFGGADASAALSTATWELPLDPGLTWRTIATTGPPSDYSPPALLMDPARNRMLLFGDYQNSTAGVWSFDLASATWSLVPASAPSHPAWSPLAGYDAARDRVILLGRAPLDDTWALPLGAPLAWAPLAASDQQPAARSGHSTIWDAPRRRAIVFGGYGQWQSHLHPQAPIYGDAWALDPDRRWTPLAPTGTAPSPRQGHSAVYDPLRQRMIVFGGRVDTEDGPADSGVWSLSLSGAPAWQRLTPPGPGPSPRWGQSAIVDAPRDRMIISGGFDGTTIDDDVWALPLSGTQAWERLSPSGTPPGARYDAAATYDPARDRMLLFGGWAGTYTTRSNDLYELALSGAPAWTRLLPGGDAPPPGYGPGAVLDGVRDRLLVFGGDDYADSVWALPFGPGGAWQALSPAGGAPMPRRYEGLVFDPQADVMTAVLGQTPCQGPDCWRPWNALGDSWTLAAPSPIGVPDGTPARGTLELAAARPTPFRAATELTFVLGESQRVRLAIIDVAGRTVRTLVRASLAAGPHRASWDGMDERGCRAPAGMYFAALDGEQGRVVTRLVRVD